ncbi:hypothetical protein BCR42DRAFT_417438 [Absidia repens]|uniref:Uncharacterized protein n=1 Tax=Absidia repens TaxID=90262 RepID=A0A1X2IDW8_9FUNG|nr:hypothetical protein BCR42DRAFT_417438 [Absidia repens]
MPTINDQVYARVHEKAIEHQLTEQEINAIDTARQKLDSHTSMGGFTGAFLAFLIGKRKNFKPIKLLALAGGGFLMGSQVGLVSGALAGINTIKALPDPQRLVDVIREVQKETLNGNNNSSSRSLPTSTTSQENTVSSSTYPSLAAPLSSQSIQGNGTFASEDPALHGEYIRSGSEFQTDRAVQRQQQNGWQINSSQQQSTHSMQAPPPPPHQQQQTAAQSSKWEQIRSENLPNSAWTRIRQEAADQKTDASTIDQAKAQRVVTLKEREVNFDDLPRTREEAEQRTTGRRNQWGDLAE